MSPLLSRVLLARAKRAFVPASQEAMGPGGQPVSPTPDQAPPGPAGAPQAGAMDPNAAAGAPPVDPNAAPPEAAPAPLPPEASPMPPEAPLPPEAPPAANGDIMVPLNAVKDLVTGVIEATKGKRTSEAGEHAAKPADPLTPPPGGPISGMPMPEGGAPQGPLKLGHTAGFLKRAAQALQVPPAAAPAAPAPSMVAQLLSRRAQVASAPAPQLRQG